MKQRLITGACYVAIILGFYFAKVYLPMPITGTLPWGAVVFDLLLLFMSVMGTFEMTRALFDKLTKTQKAVCFAFSAALIPAIDVACALSGLPTAITAMGVAFFAVAIVLVSLLVVEYEKTSIESVGCSLLTAVYPVMMVGLLSLCNHLPKGDLAILFIFVISPCADSIAYVFGRLFGKKFPKKMSPEISPKKTVVGGIGGVFGGILGAVVLFFIYNGVAGSFPWTALPWYILIGAVASLLTEFGDLVESAIKRKVGIKDMGKLMPGHGGVLDRIDGTVYCAIVVFLVVFFVAL